MRLRLIKHAAMALVTIAGSGPLVMASEQTAWTYTPAFLPVSESGMSAVSAHGSVRLQELLRAGGGTQSAQTDSPDYVLKIAPAASGDGSAALDNSGAPTAEVTDVLNDLLASLPDLLDLDFTIENVRYRPGEEVVSLGQDGAIYVKFPESVGRVGIENLRVGSGETPPLGDINLYDMTFHKDSSIRIQGE